MYSNHKGIVKCKTHCEFLYFESQKLNQLRRRLKKGLEHRLSRDGPSLYSCPGLLFFSWSAAPGRTKLGQSVLRTKL